MKTSTSLLALAVALVLTPAAAAAQAADAATAAAQAAETAAAAAAATAQQETGQPQAAGDDIIVTGTRAQGISAAESPTPIQVLDDSVLKRVGQPDLNNQLAQVLPSVQVQAFGSDQAAFRPSVKLRGLNPNHTLVLVNGKRRHGSAGVVVTGGAFGGNAAPDLGLIPGEAIARIEVLQDGAAAQYGTDAIAGVLNLILKNNDEGGSVNATAGQYFEGDGFTWDIMGNIGLRPVENMFLNITAERRFRDYSFRGDVDPRVIDTGYNTSANTGANGGRTILANFPDVRNFPNYPYVNRIVGDGTFDLTNGMFNAGFSGIEDTEIYAFGTYSRRVGRTYQNYRLPNVVVGRSPTDIPFRAGFSPQQVLRETDYAITGGAKGTLFGVDWDFSLTYGRDEHDVYVEDSANAALYYDTSTLTQAGYTPRNVYNGSFINEQTSATFDFRHELDIGLEEPINIAAGIEARHESYELREGEVASYYVGSGVRQGGIQSFFGYSPANASKNARDNFSQYLDIAVRPFEGAFVEGAVRHEHYSDFGDTTVFKVTGRYDFSPALALRGTVSTGFRAPTLAEGFYSGINVSVSSLSGVFAPNSPGAAALGIAGLQPEESTNFSAGIVLRPVERLSITLDGYSIYLRDRIVQSGSFVGYSNNCRYLPGGFTNSTDVAAARAAFTGTCTGVISPSVLSALNTNAVPIASVISAINGGAAGSVAVVTFVNGVNSVTQGFDFAANYASDFGPDWGTVDWSLSVNYNKTRITNIAAPPPNVNQAQLLLDPAATSSLTDTTPRWRATAGAFYSWGMFDINLRESFYGPTSQLQTFPTNANLFVPIGINSKFITDVELSLRPVEGIRLSVGANNLFNTYPTMYPGNASDPASFRGAQYSLSSTGYITKYPGFSPIGINGGYYYARATFNF